MSAGARLAAYAVVLGIAAGGGAVLGAAVGPDPGEDRPASHDTHDSGNEPAENSSNNHDAGDSGDED